MEHEQNQNEEKKPLEILRGNVGQDVVIEKAQIKEKGLKEVANFSVAIKDGENTKWVNCEAWDKNIEKVRRPLARNSPRRLAIFARFFRQL